MTIVELPVDLNVWRSPCTIACLGVLQEAILLPVDNRRYFAYGRILDNRLVLTINITKLLDYR